MMTATHEAMDQLMTEWDLEASRAKRNYDKLMQKTSNSFERIVHVSYYKQDGKLLLSVRLNEMSNRIYGLSFVELCFLIRLFSANAYHGGDPMAKIPGHTEILWPKEKHFGYHCRHFQSLCWAKDDSLKYAYKQMELLTKELT